MQYVYHVVTEKPMSLGQSIIFDADACNCFDGTENEQENIKKAMHYWTNDIENEKSVIETLIDGEITVVEIIKEFC